MWSKDNDHGCILKSLIIDTTTSPLSSPTTTTYPTTTTKPPSPGSLLWFNFAGDGSEVRLGEY